MTIRWRLALLMLQILVLTGGTALVTGRGYSGEAWFFAGLLAIVINPQLLEPYYPRPVDVTANSIIGLFLYLVADKTSAELGWHVLALCLLVAFLLSVFSLVFGAGRSQGRLVGLARTTRLLTQPISARKIYSGVFWLSILDFSPTLDRSFWLLGFTWFLLMIFSLVNWENIWASAAGTQPPARVEGMIGPSRLLLSAPTLPPPGKVLNLKSGRTTASGVVIGLVHRATDTWGEVLVQDPEKCRALRRAGAVNLATATTIRSRVIGAVDAGSTEARVRFVSTRPLELGQVVAVKSSDDRRPLLYQLTAAEVRDLAAKGGSHLVVRTEGTHIGRFNESNSRLERERWVPEPGAAVVSPAPLRRALRTVPENLLRLGYVVATDIPIYLDWQVASEGHLAILGMTRMGKTSLTVRLARKLAARRRVVVLDQTGEYVGKRGFPAYVENGDWRSPGLSVFEPELEDIVPDVAYDFLTEVVRLAAEEYRQGEPTKRVLIIDEAHQFVPEPSGLGFKAPGRDSAYQFGITMMQVRKYNIAIILVSQRTAVVAKSALSQCENIVAFRNVDQTGLDYLEAIGGAGVRRILPQLRQGEALVFGPAFSAEAPVVIKVDYEEG